MLMINKEKTKVLFAEANSEFADVLLSFLTLPLGRIEKLLEKHYGDKAPIFGSITNLYNSLANLDTTHFSTEAAKLMLLNPESCLDSKCRKLKIDISLTKPTKYFVCYSSGCFYPTPRDIGMYYDSAKCTCGKILNRQVTVESSEATDGGVFTVDKVPFIICDDLRMVPNARGIIQTLKNLGVNDVIDGAELRNVAFGFNEIMELLKGSIFSQTPLSDVILDNKQMFSAAAAVAKPEPAGFSWNHVKKEELSNSKKIILKVVVHKSANKLLFVQADDDFIELLASFLIINIAGVESLLCNNTGLENIDNLYRSISDVIDDKCFINPSTKEKVLKPKLPYGYLTGSPLLPLTEESTPAIYHRVADKRRNLGRFSYYQFSEFDLLDSCFKSPKGRRNYLEESREYMVTDDLTVTPLCMTSSLSILSRFNVPISDVDELDVHIDLEEALRILKASLTSNSALSDALMNRTMIKQPKQEH